MSADGSMIVGHSDTAFLWTASSGMLDLKSVLLANGATGLNGWTLTSANNITPDGRTIVGDGIDPAGNHESWIATLPAFSPGDVNLDGIVNGLDISAVATHWLQNGTGIPGDANEDGIVNGLDISMMASHWLQSSGARGSGTFIVPEPKSFEIAAVAGLCISIISLRARRQHPASIGLQARSFGCFLPPAQPLAATLARTLSASLRALRIR
jgi:hypothetical protein